MSEACFILISREKFENYTIKSKLYIFRCFNGGRCIDGVDQYKCSCTEGYSGKNCECPPEAVDDPSLCMDVNASVSWELPSRDILDSWTTTFRYDEDTTLTPLSLGKLYLTKNIITIIFE